MKNNENLVSTNAVETKWRGVGPSIIIILHMITFYMMLLICMRRSKWSNTSFSLQLCLIIVSYSPIRKKTKKDIKNTLVLP